MPAFIKTSADEKYWAKAKSHVRESYPDLSEEDEQFWAITTSIYKKIRGKNMSKKASARVLNVLQKLAYVPLTPAAEEAMAQPIDPAAAPGGGMPSTAADPAMMGGMSPMSPNDGGIQTVPGPNGEPIDPETGFIVLDPAAGIEQDPLTGILFNKSTGEFATPEGQPIPPEQAQAMIEEAMSALQQDPSAMSQMMPGMPAEMSAQPASIAMPQAAQPPAPDPTAEAMAGGQPTVDPQSGLPIDPSTGMFAQNLAEMPAEGGVSEGNLEELMTGFEGFLDKNEKLADRQDKLNKRMLHDLAGTRTDIQGVRREIQQLNDNQDTLLARLENVLNVLESMMSAPRGVRGMDR